MLKNLRLQAFLPIVGPIALLLVWELAITAKWVKPVLLPPPGETLGYLGQSIMSGAIYGDFVATLKRTMYSFFLATVVGVPLGIALGSNEKIYRSVEFLIDFFRSTPSSALIPLFLLIFGITDVNKIAIATFAAVLLIIFNSAYGVMNAKKTRVNAAITMGIPKRFIFKDVLFMESLQSQIFQHY